MRILLLIVLALGLSNTAAAIPERDAVLAELQRLQAICAGGAEALWDINFCGATLFVDRRTGEALSYDLRDKGPVTAGALKVMQVPEGFPIVNTTKYWRGKQWAVIAWPMQGSAEDRLALLLHESYHRTQGIMHFRVGFPASGVHLDDAPGRISLRLETRALAAALRATDIGVRNRHLQAAFDFRAMRMAGNDRAHRSERYQNLFEGLAEYTGQRLARGPQAARAHAIKRLADLERLREFERNYAYFTGPAWGLLLDDLSADWRARLTGREDLADVAATLLNYTPEPVSAGALGTVAERYAGGDILAQEQSRQARVEVIRDQYRERFVRGRVLVLQPESFSIDPQTEISLGADGRFFRNMDMSGNWGSLRTWRGAMMGPRPPYVYVEAIEEDGHLKLEENSHWTLDLNPGWVIVPHERGYALERRS